MKKFEHILIVSDIDGTLVGSDGIPPKNLEKLRYFLDNGGLFTISTGRNHKEIGFVTEPLADLIGLPFSICNGSALYDVKTGQVLNPQYLDPTYIKEVVDDILSQYSEKLRFHSASDESGFLCSAENEIFPLLERKQLFKILFLVQPSEIRAIYADVSAKFGKYFTFTIAASQNFEILPLGGSKKFQFPYLKEHYGATEIWAIGDYDNDIEMLMARIFPLVPKTQPIPSRLSPIIMFATATMALLPSLLTL